MNCNFYFNLKKSSRIFPVPSVVEKWGFSCFFCSKMGLSRPFRCSKMGLSRPFRCRKMGVSRPFRCRKMGVFWASSKKYI